MNEEQNEITVGELVAQVQNVLQGHKLIPTVESLARVMISLGCSLNGISGEITSATIRKINDRYYSPEQANIADALILQGYTMLTWGESHNNIQPKGEQGDDLVGK